MVQPQVDAHQVGVSPHGIEHDSPRLLREEVAREVECAKPAPFARKYVAPVRLQKSISLSLPLSMYIYIISAQGLCRVKV